MKTTLTITGKRQVTIPRSLWNKFKLEGVRYLEADISGDTLRLKKMNFAEDLQDFWASTEHLVKGSLTDASIKQASHQARQHKKL